MACDTNLECRYLPKSVRDMTITFFYDRLYVLWFKLFAAVEGITQLLNNFGKARTSVRNLICWAFGCLLMISSTSVCVKHNLKLLTQKVQSGCAGIKRVGPNPSHMDLLYLFMRLVLANKAEPTV